MKRKVEERKKMKEEKLQQKQQEAQLNNETDSSLLGRFRKLFRS